MNPYLLLIGAFALWYIPGALALIKLQYEFVDFKLLAIRADYVEFLVSLKITNQANRNIILNRLDLNILIDGVEVSQLAAENVQLEKVSKTTLPVVIRVDASKLGKSLWAMLINNDFKNTSITFNGLARSNGRPYPFTYTTNIDELLNTQ